MKFASSIRYLFILMSISCNSQVILKLANDSLFSYAYGGGDEFNEPQLNENDWKNGLGGRRVLMTQDLAFSQKNVTMADGLVNFLAIKEDSMYVLNEREVDSSFIKKEGLKLIDNKFLTKYSAGGIVSKRKYHYGLYEIRFKVDKGRGVWPAFWFYGGNKNEEIDAFELKCEKNNRIHVDTHCPYGCDRGYKNNLGLNTNWGGWLPVSNYLHDGFNIMLLEWKSDELIWYINGYPLAYFKGTFPNPMNLFLNTSVAKDGGAFKPGPDENTSWPSTFCVDYFRVWQPVPEGNEVSLNVNDDFRNSDKFISDYNSKPLKKNGFMYWKKELNPIEGLIVLSRSSAGKLKLTVLGKLGESKAGITIKNATGVQTFSELAKEIELDLGPNDKEIEVTITIGKKVYNKKIGLR